jgi:hypothetical protein
MIPPQRSDRKDYSALRDLEEQKLPEPTRPENVRSPGWTESGGMQAQQESALAYNKAANERAQQQHAGKQQDAGNERTQPERQEGQQKDGGLTQDSARSQYEQSLEKNATREVDHAAARANWEKALQGETPTKTPQQDQELQKNKDKDIGY